MKSKNIYKSLSIAGLMLLAVSCTDILDTTPTNVLTDPTVWGSKEAVDAYLGNLYSAMEVEDFEYQVGTEAQYPSQVTDEATRSYTWGNANDAVIPNGLFGWWGYGTVRNVNGFLARIVNAPLNDTEKKTYEGEARFIRAFDYFAMVKRYGGVPLITKEQVYNGNVDSLRVPRSKEADVYDFIRQECEQAAALLPETRARSERYRATKYAAYALECRAMLYAASEAKYGNVQLDGLVGIDASRANGYWQAAKEAAEKIMNSGHYALYAQDEDKESNFQNLFIDKTAANKEAIFSKGFDGQDIGSTFDYYNAPESFKIDYGCATNPTEDLVAEYEYTDGSDGALKVNDANGNPIQYSNPYDLFKDKDPRLLASVLVPFCSWQGGTVVPRRGIYDNGNYVTAGTLTDTYKGTSITIAGKDGIIPTRDVTKNGFYIKKFMNPTGKIDYGKGNYDWMVFRYGEVLLNYAEACIELGEEQNALNAINQIRNRAGIAPRTSVDRDQVRHERKMELAFENHRWWDIRRWHIADQILNARTLYGLMPYLVWEDGKSESEMKYIFRIEPAAGKNTRTFMPRLYYEAIPSSAISTNPQIVQNPGY